MTRFLALLTIGLILVGFAQPAAHTCDGKKDCGNDKKATNLLPGDANEWDEIGEFDLKENALTTKIRLFYYDTDLVAKKNQAKGRFANQIIPNWVAIHAIYQKQDGSWKHIELFSGARVRLTGVCEAKDHRSIEVQLRSNPVVLVPLSPKDTKEIDENAIKKNSQPIKMRLTIEKGIPVLK